MDYRTFTVMLRNNLKRTATYSARLQPATGWMADETVRSLTLEAGLSGEIHLEAIAPLHAYPQRKLITGKF
ncbi:hypothetical protein [Mesorhizobium sp. M0322]|uniref:hypothetical protein n=1 Tax=Mesorhizobium sp. M0322 TaxID=2956937 RepID=UPI003336056E